MYWNPAHFAFSTVTGRRMASLNLAAALTWTGLHVHSGAALRVQGAGGYLSVGVTGAPTNVTAGDVTASRLIIPDAAFVSGVTTVQINKASYVPGIQDYTMYSQTIVAPGAADWSIHGSLVDVRVRPTANSGTIGAVYATGYSANHDSGAFNIKTLYGVEGASTQGVASSTVTLMAGVLAEAIVNDGTATAAYGLIAQVAVAGGGVATLGVGVDILNSNGVSSTFTTSIGLRINAATGTIGTDIAIQSLGGQHRFVGNSRFGANTAPSFTVDVTGTINTSGAITGGSTIDAVTGYRIGNAAATNNVLMGNGTNFVSNALSWTTWSPADSAFKGPTADADWVVGAGDLVAAAYAKIGKWMIVSFVVITSTIANAPAHLRLDLPNGETVAARAYNAIPGQNNAVDITPALAALTGDTYMRIYKSPAGALGGAGWTNSTDNNAIFGYLLFEIA